MDERSAAAPNSSMPRTRVAALPATDDAPSVADWRVSPSFRNPWYALLFLFAAFPAMAQTPPGTGQHVTFLDFTPEIDGRLDPELARVPAQHFPHVFDFDNPPVDAVDVSYRLGYTATHLYVYIETGAAEITYRPRGYLSGDGYRVLLGIPEADGLASDYYELTYSPTLDPARARDRQRIAIYNHGTPRRRLGPHSISAAASHEGSSGFEALIAWEDLWPYHPWTGEPLAINLYFAKGYPSIADEPMTHGHALVPDEGIWDEEIARRAAVPLVFEPPGRNAPPALVVRVPQASIASDTPLAVSIIQVPGPDDGADGAVLSIEGPSGTSRVTGTPERMPGVPGEGTTQRIDVPMRDAGLYRVSATLAGQTAEAPFCILPDIDWARLEARLEAPVPPRRVGVAQALAFELDTLRTTRERMRPYETCEELLAAWKVFRPRFATFIQGGDPYADLHGPYRRGFRSAQDNTLQPMTIKLPPQFDPDRRYPLLVMLHGSAQDETSILKHDWSGGEAIELAPYGRDRFRAYAEPDSQADIVEAIEAAIRDFPIDRSKVVIGGFSMGGYGALRTFYEAPERYAGVAVFAGHPNLASEWLGQPHPDFTDPAVAQRFRGTPIFLYHGTADEALDISLARRTDRVLSRAGSCVHAEFVEGATHRHPAEQSMQRFRAWLSAAYAAAPTRRACPHR